jgi:hypothetical protein
MVPPTAFQLHCLSFFRRETHSVQLSKEQKDDLEKMGWVSWQPTILGCNNLYFLTELGREVCEKYVWEPLT